MEDACVRGLDATELAELKPIFAQEQFVGTFEGAGRGMRWRYILVGEAEGLHVFTALVVSLQDKTGAIARRNDLDVRKDGIAASVITVIVRVYRQSNGSAWEAFDRGAQTSGGPFGNLGVDNDHTRAPPQDHGIREVAAIEEDVSRYFV